MKKNNLANKSRFIISWSERQILLGKPIMSSADFDYNEDDVDEDADDDDEGDHHHQQ